MIEIWNICRFSMHEHIFHHLWPRIHSKNRPISFSLKIRIFIGKKEKRYSTFLHMNTINRHFLYLWMKMTSGKYVIDCNEFRFKNSPYSCFWDLTHLTVRRNGPFSFSSCDIRSAEAKGVTSESFFSRKVPAMLQKDAANHVLYLASDRTYCP